MVVAVYSGDYARGARLRLRLLPGGKSICLQIILFFDRESQFTPPFISG